jgi:hypothetical protein
MLINEDWNKITAMGVRKLIPLQWPRLQWLSLCNKCDNPENNEIGNEGAKLLAKIDMSDLRQLELSNCKLGAEAVKHLTKG